MQHNPNEYLSKLRKELPYGSIKEIAERTGHHRNYVGQVLKGKSFNQEIIDEAISVRKEHLDKLRQSEEKIKRELGGEDQDRKQYQ